MNTKKRVIIEETYNCRSYISVKSPLLIKDKKKAEELQNKLKIQEELYKIAKEVAHDIASPISSLRMVEYISDGKLPEKETRMMNLAIRSIEDMCDKLISKYRGISNIEQGKRSKGCGRRLQTYIWEYVSLQEIVENYRYSNKNTGIISNCNLDKANKFIFIKGDYSDFCRMIINIINNGIEAVEGKYKVKGEEVKIVVKDNGQGMPKEIVERIKNNEEVGTTKETGHGIGMQQIMDTIKAMKGKVEIESKEGEGTEFILTFPKSEKPIWFADKIELKKGDIVVILDDDESVHELWKEKFRRYEKEIPLKYFTDGKETVEYLKTLGKKEKVFLLTDYKLKNQNINGIDVIEKSGMEERSILFTGEYLSAIDSFNEKAKFLIMFHKTNIVDIPLEIKSCS